MSAAAGTKTAPRRTGPGPTIPGLAVAAAWAMLAGGAWAAQAPPPAGGAPAAAPQTMTRVTYISGPTVYVEAGRDDGLDTGDMIEVVRDGQVIASLSVTYLSAHRAACTIASSSAEIAVGDAARFTPHRAAAPAPPETGGASAPATASGNAAATAGGASAAGTAATAPRRSTGLHGRVGVRYLAVKDLEGTDNGFSQHGVDLWLMDQGLGAFDVFADVRARRSYHTASGDSDPNDSLTNVYRLAVAWHPGDGRQTMSFGRQFSPALSMMSLFDGVLYDFNGGDWSMGGFAGTEPEPVDLKVSSDVRDYGGYWQYRGGGAERRWETTTGAVGSYENGDPNREFIYFQGRYHGPRLTGFLVEEMDYYRGWKVDDAGESAFTLTSTFAHVHYRAGDHVTLYGGYDNRRNVRLYRDQVTPATEFDDAHRQGGWGGASFRIGDHFDLGADLRRSTGGPSGTADGYSFNLEYGGLTSANLSFNGRGTHYANETSDGWLYEAGVGLDAGRYVHLETGLGHLEETSAIESPLDRSADWLDFEVDVMFARRWFLMLSTEQYRGDDEDNDQYYGALTFRF